MKKLLERIFGSSEEGPKTEEEKREQLEKEIEDFVEMMEETASLTMLAKERDELYEHYTQEMLSMLKPVFKAAEQFLDKETVKITEWRAVELMEDEHKLMALGAVVFPVGSQVTIEDGVVMEVTEQNQLAFQRIMRIVVPIDLAEEGNMEKLTKFFKEHYSLENLPEQVDMTEDFSTENLTKEQIEKMQMFTHQAKDKLN